MNSEQMEREIEKRMKDSNWDSKISKRVTIRYNKKQRVKKTILYSMFVALLSMASYYYDLIPVQSDSNITDYAIQTIFIENEII